VVGDAPTGGIELVQAFCRADPKMTAAIFSDCLVGYSPTDCNGNG
jgi:hypothetical protein